MLRAVRKAASLTELTRRLGLTPSKSKFEEEEEEETGSFLENAPANKQRARSVFINSITKVGASGTAISGPTHSSDPGACSW